MSIDTMNRHDLKSEVMYINSLNKHDFDPVEVMSIHSMTRHDSCLKKIGVIFGQFVFMSIQYSHFPKKNIRTDMTWQKSCMFICMNTHD